MVDGLGTIDLHMHTILSDGTDTPAEIVSQVKAAGIEVFSVTDHDTVNAGRIIPTLLEQGDPSFISGIEFSCKDEQGKYHILGYGFDPDAPPLQQVVRYGHELRMKKVKDRLAFIQNQFGFVFPQEEIDRIFALDNPGKPHIGNLMVKYGYAQTKDEAITQYIDRIHFRSEYVRPQQAIEGILAAGGIPVLAHPFYGSGDELILGAEMEERIFRLRQYGLQGMEAFYSGFSSKLRQTAVALADRYDLMITAGSDYHGANKLVRLGDTGLGDTAEYPVGLRRFLEQVTS